MIKLLEKVERIVIGSLIGLMALVVLLATIEVCWLIVKDVVTPPVVILEIEELLEIFGAFLLVLIGVELMVTLRSYLTEHVLHAEVVVEVAMIAIARKVIILDLKEQPSLTLIGIAGIILALAVAFLIIRRWSRPRSGARAGMWFGHRGAFRSGHANGAPSGAEDSSSPSGEESTGTQGER